MSDIERELLALLDRIEVEEDYTLATQRFAIFENHGYTFSWGFEASKEKH